MAKAKKAANSSKKKPIDQYAHKGKQRANNPPVGLVTPQTLKHFMTIDSDNSVGAYAGH